MDFKDYAKLREKYGSLEAANEEFKRTGANGVIDALGNVISYDTLRGYSDASSKAMRMDDATLADLKSGAPLYKVNNEFYSSKSAGIYQNPNTGKVTIYAPDYLKNESDIFTKEFLNNAGVKNLIGMAAMGTKEYIGADGEKHSVSDALNDLSNEIGKFSDQYADISNQRKSLLEDFGIEGLLDSVSDSDVQKTMLFATKDSKDSDAVYVPSKQLLGDDLFKEIEKLESYDSKHGTISYADFKDLLNDPNKSADLKHKMSETVGNYLSGRYRLKYDYNQYDYSDADWIKNNDDLFSAISFYKSLASNEATEGFWEGLGVKINSAVTNGAATFIERLGDFEAGFGDMVVGVPMLVGGLFLDGVSLTNPFSSGSNTESVLKDFSGVQENNPLSHLGHESVKIADAWRNGKSIKYQDSSGWLFDTGNKIIVEEDESEFIKSLGGYVSGYKNLNDVERFFSGSMFDTRTMMDTYSTSWTQGAAVGNIVGMLASTAVLQKGFYDPLGAGVAGAIFGESAGAAIAGSKWVSRIVTGGIVLGLNGTAMIDSIANGNPTGAFMSAIIGSGMFIGAMGTTGFTPNDIAKLATNVMVQSVMETATDSSLRNAIQSDNAPESLGGAFVQNILWNYAAEMSGLGKTQLYGDLGKQDAVGRTAVKATNVVGAVRYKLKATLGDTAAKIFSEDSKLYGATERANTEFAKLELEAAKDVIKSGKDEFEDAMKIKVELENAFDRLRASGNVERAEALSDLRVALANTKMQEKLGAVQRIEVKFDSEKKLKQDFNEAKRTMSVESNEYIGYKDMVNRWEYEGPDGKNYQKAVEARDAAAERVRAKYGDEMIGALDEFLESAYDFVYNYQKFFRNKADGILGEEWEAAAATGRFGVDGNRYIPIVRLTGEDKYANVEAIDKLFQNLAKNTDVKTTFNKFDMMRMGEGVDTSKGFADINAVIACKVQAIAKAQATSNMANIVSKMGKGGMELVGPHSAMEKSRGIVKEDTSTIRKTISKNMSSMTNAPLKEQSVLSNLNTVYQAAIKPLKAMSDILSDTRKEISNIEQKAAAASSDDMFIGSITYEYAVDNGLADSLNLMQYGKVRTRAELSEMQSSMTPAQRRYFESKLREHGIDTVSRMNERASAATLPQGARRATFDEVTSGDEYSPTNKDFGKTKINKAKRTGEVEVYLVSGDGSGNGARVYTSKADAEAKAGELSQSQIDKMRARIAKRAESVQDRTRYESYDGRYVIEFEKAAENHNKAIDKQISPLELEMKVLNKELEIAKSPKPETPVAEDGAPQKGKLWDFSKKITQENAKYVLGAKTKSGKKLDGDGVANAHRRSIKKRYDGEIEAVKQQKRALVAKETTLSGKELTESRRKLGSLQAEIEKLEKARDSEISKFNNEIIALKEEYPKARAKREKAYQDAMKRYEKAKAKSGDGMPTRTNRSPEEVEKDIESTQAKIDELNEKKVKIDGTRLKDAGADIPDALDYIKDEISSDVRSEIESRFSKTVNNRLRALRRSDNRYYSSYDWTSRFDADVKEGNVKFDPFMSKLEYGTPLRKPSSRKVTSTIMRTSDIAWEDDTGGYINKPLSRNALIKAGYDKSIVESENSVKYWNELVSSDPDFKNSMFSLEVMGKKSELKKLESYKELKRRYDTSRLLGDGVAFYEFKRKMYSHLKEKNKEDWKDITEGGVLSKPNEWNDPAFVLYKTSVDSTVDEIVTGLSDIAFKKTPLFTEEMLEDFERFGIDEKAAREYVVMRYILGDKELSYKSAASNAYKKLGRSGSSVDKVGNQLTPREAIAYAIENDIRARQYTNAKEFNADKAKAKKAKKAGEDVDTPKRSERVLSFEQERVYGNTIYNDILSQIRSNVDRVESTLKEKGGSSMIDTEAYIEDTKALHKTIMETYGQKEEGTHIIKVVGDDGVTNEWRVNDSLYNMLSNTYDFSKPGPIAKFSAFTNRMFRRGTTGAFSPASWINQWFKDPLNAYMMSGAVAFKDGAMSTIFGEGARALLNDEYMKSIGDTVVKDFESAATKEEIAVAKESAAKAGKSYEEFMLDQVTTGQVDSLLGSITDKTAFWTNKALNGQEAFYAEMGGSNSLKGKSKSKVKQWADGVTDKIHETASNASVNVAREAYLRSLVYNKTFQGCVKNGMSVNDAKIYAERFMRDATTNFNRSFVLGNSIVKGIPYLSAAMNGLDSFWRLAEIDPIGLGQRFSMISVAYMQALTVSLSDERNREQYLNLKEYQKEGNLVWFENGVGFSVPVPDEIQMLLNPIRQAVEKSYNANDNTFWQLAFSDILNLSSLELSGFMDLDKNTQTESLSVWENVGEGARKLASQLLPPATKTAIMAVTGVDMYTGAEINKSRYAVNEETGKLEIVDNEQGVLANTFAKWCQDSELPLLKNISASAAAKIFSGIIGSSGYANLEGITTLIGGEDTATKESGLNKILDRTLNPVTVEVYDQAKNDRSKFISNMYRLKNELEDPNSESGKKIDALKKEMSSAGSRGDEDAYNKAYSQIKTIYQDYQKQVLSGVNALNQKYGDAFYTRNFQASVISLMIMGQDTPVVPYENYTTRSENTAEYYEARNLAVQTMADMGFPNIMDGRDISIFGYGYYDNSGNYQYKYASPISIMALDSAESASGRIITDQFMTRMERTGLKAEKKALEEQINAMYDSIEGKEMSSADWTAFNKKKDALYLAYDEKLFANVILPELVDIEASGQSVEEYLQYNWKEIGSLVKVPSAYMGKGKYDKKITSKEFAYSKKFIEDMYNTYKKALKGGK